VRPSWLLGRGWAVIWLYYKEVAMLHILRRTDELKRYTFCAEDGDIGKLREVYFDDAVWTVRYLVINTGTWLTGSTVLIIPDAVESLNEEEKTVQVKLTREHIETSPTLEAKQPLSRQQEAELHQHYSWLPYWRSKLSGATHSVEVEKGEKADPHLRSSAEVKGYQIEARDGEIGYVEDFIVDDNDWVVRYLEISTHYWWFGKKILVAPAWIGEMNWKERKVHVDLLREAIRSAPEYNENEVIGRDYEISLYTHYGRSQYWNEKQGEER
jgi:hypothetical protein